MQSHVDALCSNPPKNSSTMDMNLDDTSDDDDDDDPFDASSYEDDDSPPYHESQDIDYYESIRRICPYQHRNDLEQLINEKCNHATLLKKEIDLDLAKEVMKNIVKEIQSDVSVDFIQKTVGDYFRVELDAMKGKVKKREIVIPRQVAMYFCKRYTQLTLALIGENFGGRDHSTVIHALESVEDMMKTDPNFRNSVDELTKKLKMRMAS